MGGDLQASTGMSSKYNNLFHKVDKKLEMDRASLEDLSKTYQVRLREQERVKVELQRLRSDLANREAKVDQLRSQALEWKQKCLSATLDRDGIRTHLAQLASGTLRLPSGVLSAASATTPTSNRSRPTETHPPIKRPRTAKMTRSRTDRWLPLRPSQPVGSRDPLGLCNPPHNPDH